MLVKNRGLIITLILVLSVLALVILGFLVFLLTRSRHFGYFNFGNSISKELVLEESYESNFEQIVVDTSSAEVEIKTSTDDQIKVLLYGDKDRVNVHTQDGKLKVTVKGKKCFGFCLNQKVDKVELYVPETFAKEIEINNNYGDISVGSFPQANIIVEEDCGDVFIQSGNEVKVNNNFGDIEIEEVNVAHVKESAGDVTIGSVQDATIHNSYGDIKVREVLNFMDIKQDCGDVKVEKALLNKNSKIENHLGDIKIGETNEIYIEAKTSLGDTKINQNYHKADITLKISNSCGSIKVDN